MSARLKILFILFMLTAALVKCGDGYVPEDKAPTYPDSVYGKAKFGEDKYN